MSLPRLDCRMVLRTSTLTRGQTHDSEKDSRPRANIERPAEIPFNCLVVSRLREDRQLAQTSDSQGSGGRIPPGWWFSASGQAKIERGSYILGKCLAEVPSKSSWARPNWLTRKRQNPYSPRLELNFLQAGSSYGCKGSMARFRFADPTGDRCGSERSSTTCVHCRRAYSTKT
jgi:hypothetical protein